MSINLCLFHVCVLMTLKVKYPIHNGGFSTPSQMNVLNLILNSSEANKDHKVFVIGGIKCKIQVEGP